MTTKINSKMPMKLQFFASPEGLSTDLGKAQSIDFVERFGLRVNPMFALLEQMRKISMATGSTIQTYESTVTLDDTPVAPGEVIPLSEVQTVPGPSHVLEWDKKRTAVAAEDIQKYGLTQAINRTDEKLINQLQKKLRTNLIENLATGTGVRTAAGFQQLLARNTAAVKIAFDEDDPQVISFANTEDVFDYLGDKEVTMQTAFGMDYLENFLGNKVVFVSGSIPRGTIYSTAVDNMVFYFVDMDNGDVGQTFDFTTGEDGIIGVKHYIDYERLTANTTTAYGYLWLAENLSGVVIGTFGEPAPDEGATEPAPDEGATFPEDEGATLPEDEGATLPEGADEV